MGKRSAAWVILVSILCVGLTARAQEVCDDCVDDDGDGLVDCYDPDCFGDAVACGGSFVTSGPQSVDCGPRPLVLQQLWRVPGAEFSSVLVGDIDGDFETEVLIEHSGFTLHDGRTGMAEGMPPMAASTVSGSYSMGDVDLDGTVEIFDGSHAATGAGEHENSIARYEHDLSVSYLRLDTVVALRTGAPPLGLADIDHDGLPELQQIGAIVDPVDGALLLDLRPDFLMGGHPFGANAMAVDLLPDEACATCAGLEVTTGNRVYGVDLATATYELAAELGDVPGPSGNLGPFAVADWNGDQALDIILARSWAGGDSTVNVWDPRTEMRLVPEYVPNESDRMENTPLVADVDGDCEPEIVLLVTDADPPDGFLRVLDNDMSVMWELPSPENSDWTSAVAFDFDADGIPEIVHRGSTFLRIYSALDGMVRAQVFCRSLTTLFERVVVADINDDGQADILSGCDDEVIAWTVVDAAPARRVHNQFHYFNVNVEDDLTIPCVQQPHSVAGLTPSLNSFLQQSTLLSQGRPGSDWCACDDPVTAMVDVVSPCSVSPVVLDASASTGCSVTPMYRWLDETGAVACDWSPSSTCEVTASGRYTVEVACGDDKTCWSSANASLVVRDSAIEAGPDVEACPGESVVLTGSVLADCPDPRYEWRDASGVLRPFDPDPRFEITPIASRTYTLVVDCGGCLVEDEVRVELATFDLDEPFGAHLRATGGTFTSVDFAWPGARPSAIGEHVHVYRAERAQGPFRLVAPLGVPHADLGDSWSDLDAIPPLLFYDVRRANCLEEISASPWRGFP
ncbi:MAG: VCBS repeat-containing protein [Acidobacteriota bacterium]